MVRKCKDVPKSLLLALPKTKEGCIGILEFQYFFDNNEGEFLTADLSNSVTNSVTSPESYQASIVDLSLIPTKESKLSFDQDVPIPQNFQFQLDLLNVRPQHHTDLKLHNEIISVIKNHSNEQQLTFYSSNLKTRSSLLKHLERNIDTAKLRPKDIVVDLTFGGQATVSIFDLETMIMSLLSDSRLMQPKNMAPGYDVFTGKSVGCEVRYVEIHTGDSWEPAHQHFCGDHPMNMPIALVIFGDKAHLDLHGSPSTLPIIFTLSCVNQESRNKDKFWCTLAFLPNLSYETLTSKSMMGCLQIPWWHQSCPLHETFW